MYIHLGSGTVVNSKSIVGIFDIDYCSVSKRTREFLTAAQKSNRVVNVTDELPKSFIVCKDNNKTILYISGVSPATITKRANSVDILK
ncbi:MAG: DUF370 domain-containing protein [Oscillospiraceae bacterium]